MMAEIFDKLTYAPVQSVQPGNLPTIDFAGQREAARTAGAMSEMLDRVSNFAFKETSRRNTIEGAALGAQDPAGTLQQLQGQNPADFNVGEAAAYEAAMKGLGAEIEVKAREAMGREYLESVKLNETPDQLAERLDMAVVGFSDSLGLLSPQAAGEMSTRLDSYRNAQYLNFSESHIKQQRQENRAEGASGLVTMSESLEGFARSTVMLNDDGIEAQLETMANFLRTHQFSEEEIANEIIKQRRKAHIARVRGTYDRLESPEKKLEYADTLEESLSKKDLEANISRGLDDNTVQTLVSNFRTMATADMNALNGEIASVRSDAVSKVTNIVSSGGVPVEADLNGIKASIAELEARGGNTGKIAEVKEIVNIAEQNIEYIRSIQSYSIEELKSEFDRLSAVRDEGATPSDILRLKVVKSRLAPLVAEANAQNTAWGKQATFLEGAIGDLEAVVNDFRPIGDDQITPIEEAIDQMERAGADVTELRSEVDQLVNRAKAFEQIRMQGPDAINRYLQDLNADEEITPGENQVINLLSARLSATETGLNKDALSWAAQNGVVELNNNLIEIVIGGQPQDVANAVSLRIQNANAVAGHYGTPRSILTKNEASLLATSLTELPPDVAPQILGKLVQAFGSDALKVMEQISPDAPELAHIGGLIVGGSSVQTIEAAMLGRIAKLGNEVRYTGEQNLMRGEATKIMPIGTTPTMVTALGRITEVADSIYIGMGGSVTASGVIKLDTKQYALALDLAAGAIVVDSQTTMGGFDKYNGEPVLLPNNIKKDGGLDDLFDGLTTEESFAAFGVTRRRNATTGVFENVPANGMPIGEANGQPISLNAIKKMNLVTVGDGLYKLKDKNGHIAKTASGSVFLIDLKAMASR